MLAPSCPDEETVLAFIEGELEAPLLAGIDAHLTECASCRERLKASISASRDVGPDLTPTAPASGLQMLPREGPLARGVTIGRYVILNLVARGGMGEVYAAYDPQLDRRIAVKLLSVERSDVSTTEARARLLREAKSIARLSNPNVVVVYDSGTWEDRVFIAMEFVEGDTLAQWLKARPRDWREIRDVFVEAGRGLAAAHAAGLVHRDFKPQNVMVGRDGKVRVTDFGLARELETNEHTPPRGADATEPGAEPSQPTSPDTIAPSLTQTGVLIGTPAYMAPEQFRAEPADARTDQFSFCVALY